MMSSGPGAGFKVGYAPRIITMLWITLPERLPQ
jgi:hypothetical protein